MLLPKQPIVLPVQPGLPPFPAIRAVLVARRVVFAVLHKSAVGGLVPLGTVRQGDVGTVFEVEIHDENGGVVDVSNSAVRYILFGRPVTGWFHRQADFTTDGTDGKIRYKTQPGDLDVAGQWRLQAKVALPTFVDEFHTEMGTFYVEPVIEEMNQP